MWPLSVRIARPLAASHSPIVLSELAEASVLPSGLHATVFTVPVVAAHVRSVCPLDVSHKRIVWSLLAEASVLPSGLHATL